MNASISRQPKISSRSAYIQYLRGCKKKHGSGLQITGTLILTADHCAAGDDIRVTVAGIASSATVRWRSDDPKVDIAILQAANLPPVDPMPLARIDTESDARIPVKAYGYPNLYGTEIKEANGYLPLAEGADAHLGRQAWNGTFHIQDAPLDAERPKPKSPDKSPWAGFSGSSIIHTESRQILGIVRGHVTAAGMGSLKITPLNAIDTLEPKSVTEFCTILGVDLPGQWPIVSTDTPAREPRQVGRIPEEPRGYVDRVHVTTVTDEIAATGPAKAHTLLGLRGVGKTQVAGAIARHCRDQGWDLVALINADTQTAALTDLGEVAYALDVADPDGDPHTSATRLRDHLSADTVGRNLLIFDNASDADLLRAYIPVGRCHTVITTTEQGFAQYSGHHIEVGTYGRDQSIGYLHAITSLNDASGADLLADELGDLALALAAAAATIKRRRYSYSDYLTVLLDYPLAQALTRVKGQDYPASTAEALSLALDAVGGPDSLARHLATIIALLAPDGVEKLILRSLATPNVTELQVDEAIGELCELSLLIHAEDDEVLGAS